MTGDYEIGDVALITFDFTDINGAPVDPLTVSITVTQPDLSVIIYSTALGTVTNDPAAVGRFTCTHDITMIGNHSAKAVTTSPKSAATVRFTSVG